MAGTQTTAIAIQGPTGPQGPQGPIGPPGPASAVTGGSGITITGGSTVSLDMTVLDGSYWKFGGNTGGGATDRIGTTNNTVLSLMAKNLEILKLGEVGKSTRFELDGGQAIDVRLIPAGGGIALDRLITIHSPIGAIAAYMTPQGDWLSTSDRNMKENIRAIDCPSMLEKVARLPVTTWNYVGDEPAIRYLGPMAQDFHAAFGLGDERHISARDMSAVALAAIQGLQALIQEKQQQIDALEARLSRLEASMRE